MTMKDFILVSAVALATGVASQSSQAALTTYYRFDDGSGTVATETTGLLGNSNAELNNGAAWTTGQLGGAVHFQASSQQYALAPTYVKPTNSMSMSVWVYGDTLVGNGSIVKNWGNSTKGQFHFGLTGTTGKAHIYIVDSAGQKGPSEAPTALNTNIWYNVGFVVDASTGKFRLYINGDAVGPEVPYNGTLVSNSLNSLGIGFKTGNDGITPDSSNPGYWNGAMDDLGIFNAALTAGQMKAVYNLALQSTVDNFGTSDKYDLGHVNQIFTAWAAAGSTTVAGDPWTYAANLGSIKGGAQSGDLFAFGGQTYLLLDGINDTGMVFSSAVPEPRSFILALLGAAGMWFSVRRWRIY